MAWSGDHCVPDVCYKLGDVGLNPLSPRVMPSMPLLFLGDYIAG